VITPTKFVALRPYAFHTTTSVNFTAIRHWRRLRSAQDLLSGTTHGQLLRERRVATQVLVVEGIRVEIRDQRPLHQGHIVFEPGFSFHDLLAELNSRVFLWPGTATGPIDRGAAHFQRYVAEGKVVVLRCSMNELLAINGEKHLYVASCNSGAPRRNPVTGPSLRGWSTFQLLAEASFPPGAVKELSFRLSAALPATTEWAESFEGPWQPVWPVVNA
jgi:hypothetical protein